MNNPYIRFFIILTVPLLVGFGIGYIVKPSGVQPASAADATFDQPFSQSAHGKKKIGRETIKFLHLGKMLSHMQSQK